MQKKFICEKFQRSCFIRAALTVAHCKKLERRLIILLQPYPLQGWDYALAWSTPLGVDLYNYTDIKQKLIHWVQVSSISEVCRLAGKCVSLRKHGSVQQGIRVLGKQDNTNLMRLS